MAYALNWNSPSSIYIWTSTRPLHRSQKVHCLHKRAGSKPFQFASTKSISFLPAKSLSLDNGPYTIHEVVIDNSNSQAREQAAADWIVRTCVLLNLLCMQGAESRSCIITSADLRFLASSIYKSPTDDNYILVVFMSILHKLTDMMKM